MPVKRVDPQEVANLEEEEVQLLIRLAVVRDKLRLLKSQVAVKRPVQDQQPAINKRRSQSLSTNPEEADETPETIEASSSK